MFWCMDSARAAEELVVLTKSAKKKAKPNEYRGLVGAGCAAAAALASKGLPAVLSTGDPLPTSASPFWFLCHYTGSVGRYNLAQVSKLSSLGRKYSSIVGGATPKWMAASLVWYMHVKQLVNRADTRYHAAIIRWCSCWNTKQLSVYQSPTISPNDTPPPRAACSMQNSHAAAWCWEGAFRPSKRETASTPDPHTQNKASLSPH